MTRFPDGIDGKSFFQKDAPGFRARLDPHRADVERGHPARDRLLRLRRRRVAALRRQPGHDSAAHLGQPGADPRAAGLVRARSRSEGGAVRATWSRSRWWPATLCERIGLPLLREDQRLVGSPHPGAAGPAVHATSSRASLGELLARCRRRRAAGHRHDHPAGITARTARSTSTTSRTAAASCSSRRSACGHCPARRCRCRWPGGR